MIEPDLLDYHGHCFNFAKSVCREAFARQLDFKILVSDRCLPEIRSTLPSEAVFPPRPSNNLFRSLITRYVYAPLAFNLHLLRGLNARSLSFLGPSWLVYMGTTQHLHLFALFAWLRRFKPEQAPALVLTLRLGLYRSDLHRWTPSVVWYLLSLRLMERLARRYRIYFVTDSALLVAEFRRLTRLPIHVLPIPHMDLIEVDKMAMPSRDRVIRMVSLGSARSLKGFDTLAQSIRLLHERGQLNNLAFDLHCCHSAGEPAMFDAIASLKRLNLPNVTLVEKMLDEPDYFRMLARADVALIPYSQYIYRANTSGTFAEALAAGKPVVVTEGTWMSDQLEKYGAGVMFRDRDVDDLVRAILEARDSYPRLAAQAQARRAAWVAYHNPDNFVGELLKVVNGTAGTS